MCIRDRYNIPHQTLFTYVHLPTVQPTNDEPAIQQANDETDVPADQNRPQPELKIKFRTIGHPTVFDLEEEQMLCDNLATVGDWGFPVLHSNYDASLKHTGARLDEKFHVLKMEQDQAQIGFTPF